MADTRKIIRVFLASPGDLQEERKIVRDAVSEFNDSLADEFGYHIELMGWEDTIAGFGRPQGIINQDLDRCDLFIGMMWKRWGTPPDNDGAYSSGFQEEFSRSIDRREDTGKPEISMYFKTIEATLLEDPGPDLRQVLDFKSEVISRKQFLYQQFSNTSEIESLVRKRLIAYVRSVKAEERRSKTSEDRSRHSQLGLGASADHSKNPESSPLSPEGFNFLWRLAEHLGKDGALDSITESEIARFRLLANSISKPGNDAMEVGIHDINILFRDSFQGMQLGRKEAIVLMRLGFRHYSDENTPIWRWYSFLQGSKHDPAMVSALIGADDDERIGAIDALRALERELPSDGDRLTRERIIDSWFSEGSSTALRNAALNYLGTIGRRDDLEVAKLEYDRNDYGTSRSALECMIRISLRIGTDKEVPLMVLNHQFDSLDVKTLRAALTLFDRLDTQELRLGIEHRNSDVRLKSLALLASKREIDDDLAKKLIKDNDAYIRDRALKLLLERGVSFSAEEIRNILVRPGPPQPMSFLSPFADGQNDKKGEELLSAYKASVLMTLKKDDLEEKILQSLSDDAYFALVEKYFARQSSRLRDDVDERYASYFAKHVDAIRSFGTNPSVLELANKSLKLEVVIRKELTRKGLDVLCRKGKIEDLARIRENLESGYVESSKLDAEYLEKHGEWSDLTLLIGAKGRSWQSGTVEDRQEAVARAATRIGGGMVSELMSLEMPAVIRRRVIELTPDSRFAKISDEALAGLLDSPSAQVRRAACIKAIRSLPVKRIRSNLHDYLSRDGWYYNVVHWLDLGASMPRRDARRVTDAALG